MIKILKGAADQVEERAIENALLARKHRLQQEAASEFGKPILRTHLEPEDN